MTADPRVCVSCGRLRLRRGEGGWQGAQGRCTPCYKALPPSRRGGKPGPGRPPGADPYDAVWAAGEPERRIDRARPFAADLIRTTSRRDAEGVRRVFCRFAGEAGAGDWMALALVLAECAGAREAAEVTGVPQLVRGAA